MFAKMNALLKNKCNNDQLCLNTSLNDQTLCSFHLNLNNFCFVLSGSCGLKNTSPKKHAQNYSIQLQPLNLAPNQYLSFLRYAFKASIFANMCIVYH